MHGTHHGPTTTTQSQETKESKSQEPHRTTQTQTGHHANQPSNLGLTSNPENQYVQAKNVTKELS